MPEQKPVWRMPPFVALFADPFVGNTELEGGHIAYSCRALSYAVDRFLGEPAVGEPAENGVEEKNSELKNCPSSRERFLANVCQQQNSKSQQQTAKAHPNAENQCK